MENAIETNMKEDITVRCTKCEKDTTHIQVRNFVFLPKTLVLCFTRFEVDNGITRKNSAEINLPLDLKQLGNMSCHYEFRSCALHHGTQIENGHYNALILDDYEVFLIDDDVISKVTDDWVYRAQHTVYMAFYIKHGPSYSLTTQLENKFYPMSTNNENTEDTSHTENTSQRNNSNVQNSSTDQGFTSADERTNQVYDVSHRNKVICSHRDFCYDDDLKGEDFKTLEYPVQNTSYSLESPGWLNDKIVDAYNSLLVEAASEKGIRVQALNCFFYTRLKKFAFYLLDEERLLRMIFERKAFINFEECDYVLIPINNNNIHWTTIVLDIWNSCIYYYDPMGKGIRNDKAINLIRIYCDAFYKWRKTCEVRINNKLILKDSNVIWENSFDCQKDSASCGVFVLMYASHKLGLLTYDPASERISNMRYSMASELLMGKHISKHSQDKQTSSNRPMCSCATSYKQEIGKEVNLYCKAFPSFGNKFCWMLGQKTVSNEQVYTFRVTEKNIGTYFCYVEHENGDVSHCNCDVTILRRPSCDRNLMLTELKSAMAAICKECL
jgi:hypothetical protein